MLPLLPLDQMGKLLGDRLLEKGWTQATDSVNTVMDGFDLKFNPKTQTLDIVLICEEEVSREIDGEIEIYDDGYNEERARNAAPALAKYTLESQIRDYRQNKQNELQARWKEDMPQVHQKIEMLLEEALLSTHQEALRQKASGMGEIVSETDDNGDLVIRVKV